MQEEPKKPNNEGNLPPAAASPPCYPQGMLMEPLEDEINLLDLLIVLLKHKKMIVAVVFLAGIALLVAFPQISLFLVEQMRGG